MGQISLLSQNIHKHTLINNLFIDSYMPSANGDYVKVYIYLLRLVLSNQVDFTTAQIAKQLGLIESDVIRALKYWNELKVIEVNFEGDDIKSIGLLSLERAEDTLEDTASSEPQIHSKANTPIEIARHKKKPKKQERSAKLYKKPEYSMEEMAMMAEETEFKQLLYITEKYLAKQLTQTDVNTLLGFVDWLGLPIDVVEYLIEHCASDGHRHMNYIEKVAIDWSDRNIKTVEQAKSLMDKFNKNYYRIFKALGISNRQPTPPQIKLMDQWIDELNFALEVVELACAKTISAINKPELKYVNTILTRWHKEGAKSVKDIENLDAKYIEVNSQKNKLTGTKEKPVGKSNNRFHNHDQRTYDYSLLEERMNEMIETGTYEKRS